MSSQQFNICGGDFEREQASALIQSIQQQVRERPGARAKLDHCIVRFEIATAATAWDNAAELSQNEPTVNGSRIKASTNRSGDFCPIASAGGCLGGRDWIEADPDKRRVLVLSVPTTNVWIDSPAKLMRWRQLDETGTKP